MLSSCVTRSGLLALSLTALWLSACGSDTSSTKSDAGAGGKDAAGQDAAASDAGSHLGKTCGGIAALECSADQFCNYEKSAGGTGCMGVADASGKCESIPQQCAEVFAPVCGCDYRSYPSSCDAHTHSAAVMHTGLCTGEECTLGGGRPAYSDGASIPTCKAGETSFDISADEPALCCLPAG